MSASHWNEGFAVTTPVRERALAQPSEPRRQFFLHWAEDSFQAARCTEAHWRIRRCKKLLHKLKVCQQAIDDR